MDTGDETGSFSGAGAIAGADCSSTGAEAADTGCLGSSTVLTAGDDIGSLGSSFGGVKGGPFDSAGTETVVA